MANMMPTVGYASHFLRGNWTFPGSFSPFFTFTPVGRSVSLGVYAQNSIIHINHATSNFELSDIIGIPIQNGHDYVVNASPNNFSWFTFKYNSTRTAWERQPVFLYMAQLLNVNTNFNYYTQSDQKRYIIINIKQSTFSALQSTSFASHFIAGANKALLQSGRAAYGISCSDGQTPGSQWATDLWVYENNATLGFPVIGRAPNLLLGTGSYTYLKPVKIQGSVFPDSGSPWYLPVGNFAGKVLLMRCYSSIA